MWSFRTHEQNCREVLALSATDEEDLNQVSCGFPSQRQKNHSVDRYHRCGTAHDGSSQMAVNNRLLHQEFIHRRHPVVDSTEGNPS